jgi:hypothetical protein
MAIFFTSPEHRQRLLAAAQQIGKIHAGRVDPEYGAARLHSKRGCEIAGNCPVIVDLRKYPLRDIVASEM